MSDITLHARLANMLTDAGRTALLTIINATCTIQTGSHPIDGWQTGLLSTSDHFQAGTDAEGLPEIIAVSVNATIPTHTILAQGLREHQILCLH